MNTTTHLGLLVNGVSLDPKSYKFSVNAEEVSNIFVYVYEMNGKWEFIIKDEFKPEAKKELTRGRGLNYTDAVELAEDYLIRRVLKD